MNVYTLCEIPRCADGMICSTISHPIKKRHNNISSEWRVTSHNAIKRMHAFPIKSWESKASSYSIDTMYKKGKLKVRQASAHANASVYNILTRFLFNYQAVMPSLRFLITLSPTGSELIPDARLESRFLANSVKMKRRRGHVTECCISLSHVLKISVYIRTY